MVVVLSFIVLVYFIYWMIMDYYFHKDRTIDRQQTENALPFSSIIVCAHNEEKYIKRCLESLIKQKNISQYAEIILVNDGSDDDTLNIAESELSKSNVKYKIINHSKNLGKKNCIEKAVEICDEKSEYVILRDADTYVTSDEWFTKLLSNAKGCDLLIAPVITEIKKCSLLEYFQYFEGLALMHLTKASLNFNIPILCNGANLVFKKSTFLEINPYQDNKHILSGDDIFLLRKIHAAKGIIYSAFLKDTIVYTYPPDNINDLMRQKIRWLSKTGKINHWFNFLSAVIIALANVSLFVLVFFSVWWFLLFFLLKIIIDTKIIFSVKKLLNLPLFKRVNEMYKFFIAELLYIPYVCALIFGYILKFSKK